MEPKDSELHRGILAALESELVGQEVGIAVHDGVVTLSGHVDSHRRKRELERILCRLDGVAAVADELEVRPSGPRPRDDAENVRAVGHLSGVRRLSSSHAVRQAELLELIQARIEAALVLRAQLDAERIFVEASNGTVILRGTVYGADELDVVLDAVQATPGVSRIRNKLRIAE